MRLRTAALLAVVGAVALGTAAPAAAAETGTASWNPDLVAGESAGVVVADGTARLDHSGTHLLPADDDGVPVPTGLLTLPTHTLEMPTDRVDIVVDGDLPEGSTAAVDVRGLRASGGWTEWVPASTGTGTTGTATLPEPTSQVQTRLVLTGEHATEPTVRGVTVTAHRAAARTEAVVESAALNYRVFATREGLVGGTTANGHVIAERDHFVALPSRRALSPRGTSDYSVKVCAPNGRCAFAPVWDVGPWNTRDDYWNPAEQRQEWKDLPQGLPQAQAAHVDGYNGGRDQYGRSPSNPAGIDLGDGLFWDALGLTDNSWVTVDYLWTGSVRLSLVSAEGPIDVRSAPDAAADVVGVAAESAAVPVECALVTGAATWLRIGTDQYIDADVVSDTEGVTACDASDATGPADAAAGGAAPSGDLPGASLTGNSVSDGPTAGDPATGGPVTDSTVTGSTVTGSTVTGSTVTDSTVTGSSVTSSSATGSSATSSPVTGSPATSTPVTGGPATGTPVTGGPTTTAPTSGTAPTVTGTASGSPTPSGAPEAR